MGRSRMKLRSGSCFRCWASKAHGFDAARRVARSRQRLTSFPENLSVHNPLSGLTGRNEIEPRLENGSGLPLPSRAVNETVG